MIKKILTSKISSIASAAVIISVLGLVSRLVGLVRDQVLVGSFGASEVLDVYYAAFRIPDFVYSLVIFGALSAGFIPIMATQIQKEDGQKSSDNPAVWALVNNVVNIFSLFLIIVSVGLFIFARPLIDALVSGFSEEQKNQTVLMTRIMFLSPIFLGLSGIFGGVLQSFKRFVIYSISPVLYNLGIIAGALFGVKFIGWIALPIGVVFGAALHFLIQLIASFRLGYRYRLLIDFRDKRMRQIFRLMGPRVLSLATNQITALVTTFFNSFLIAGSLTVYNIANNLQSLPLGLIGIPLAIAAFPTLASTFAKQQHEEFNRKLESTMRLVIFTTIPITVFCLLLNVSLVTSLFGFGKFDWQSADLTAQVFGALIISLVPQCLIPLLARAYFARHNTSLPFYASLIGSVVTILLNWILVGPFGVLGLALAFSVGSLINFLILIVTLEWQAEFFVWRKVLSSFVKICAASAISGLAVVAVQYLNRWLFQGTALWESLVELISGLTIGVICFVACCFWFKCPEMRIVWTGLKKRLINLSFRRRPPEVINKV